MTCFFVVCVFFALEEGLEDGGEVVRSLEPSMEEDIVGEVGIVVAVEGMEVTGGTLPHIVSLVTYSVGGCYLGLPIG